jgi:hypothetical protein
MVKEDFPKIWCIPFRYEVLLLFSLFEVLLYDKYPVIQIAVSLLEYSFLFICIIINKRVGVMYLIAFTLLSLGSWSYVIQEVLPNNFWGIRFMGFSLNILFSIFVSVYLWSKDGFKIKKSAFNLRNDFFAKFILFSSVIGLIFVFFSVNYIDTYIKDLLVYLPYFIYLYLLSFLNTNDLKLIVKYGISLSVVTMLISYITQQFFFYGGNFTFVLMNSFSFVMIFTIFFFKNLYSNKHYFFLSLSMLFLLLTGKVFIGTKSIIILILLIIWLFYSSKNNVKLALISLLCIIFLIGPLIDWITVNLSNNLLLSYKFLQITNVFDFIDLEMIAFSGTSMGNIVAELMTLFSYLKDNVIFLITGKGFGGAVADVHGYLAGYVGSGGGYGEIDLIRNQFTRMHLPIFEIIIKTGLIGLWYYLKLLINAFQKKEITSFAFFIVFLTVFSNTKEMFLLCMIFYILSYKLNVSDLIKTKEINTL